MQLSAAQFPGGISADDLATANAHLAYLAGIVSQVAQTFQVQTPDVGLRGRHPRTTATSPSTTANVYIQDNWRARPGLTIRGGIKWEYFSPLREDNNLFLLPVQARPLDDRRAAQSRPAPSTSSTAGCTAATRTTSGRPIGFAWDPSKNGRTAVRGAYTMAFVNEETITVARNAAIGNSGLTTAAALTNQYAAARRRRARSIPTPAFHRAAHLRPAARAEPDLGGLRHRQRDHASRRCTSST